MTQTQTITPARIAMLELIKSKTSTKAKASTTSGASTNSNTSGPNADAVKNKKK